jgi:hypothetical protein
MAKPYKSHSLNHATESMNIEMFALSVARCSLVRFVKYRMFPLSTSRSSSLNFLNKKTAICGQNSQGDFCPLLGSFVDTHKHVGAIIYETGIESSI